MQSTLELGYSSVYIATRRLIKTDILISDFANMRDSADNTISSTVATKKKVEINPFRITKITISKISANCI